LLRSPVNPAFTFRGKQSPQGAAHLGHTESQGATVQDQPRRAEEVADFFAAHQRRLQRRLASKVRARVEVLEDACAIAWTTLVRRSSQATAALKHRYADLLAAGAELHEVPGTVVHAKVVVAEDR
jgi:hypothetical protein